MWVSEARGFAESDAVDNWRVVEFVGDDGVVSAQQRLKQPGIGVETTGVEDRVFTTMELGDLALEPLV